MRAYQNIANNACPHIDAELLLMSRLNNSVRIFLCLLVVVMKINYAIPGEGCFSCKRN
jgi:hypothetical protein